MPELGGGMIGQAQGFGQRKTWEAEHRMALAGRQGPTMTPQPSGEVGWLGRQENPARATGELRNELERLQEFEAGRRPERHTCFQARGN